MYVALIPILQIVVAVLKVMLCAKRNLMILFLFHILKIPQPGV